MLLLNAFRSAEPARGRLFALLAVALVFAFSAACSREPESQEPEHHYLLSGVVVSLDPKLQTAVIKHGPIKGWMDAMTMEYPIRSKDDFAKLHEGDRITASVDVSGLNYSLSNVQVQSGSQ